MRVIHGLCAVVVVAVAGCSSHPTPARTHGNTGAATSRGATPSPVVQHPLPSGTIPNVVTKRKAIAISGCSAVSGGWQVEGSASNSGTARQTFEITIFFTTASATVLDFARTTVTVEAGRTQKWYASANFTAPRDTVCVLRGVA